MTESSATGQCHCGNLSFALRWNGELRARSCGCSFCLPRAASWASLPSAKLEVSVQAPTLVSRYTFGTHSAIFQVCARCGSVPVSTSEIDGGVYAVINIHTLVSLDASSIPTQPVDLTGEDIADRLARRKRSWIANVRFTHPDSEPTRGTFRTTRSVLFGECDPGGIVYTPQVAHYVVEAAMLFMTERLGTSAARLAFQSGYLPPARVLHIEYLSPLTYDDRIEIEVDVEHVGERSWTLSVRAHRLDRTPSFAARLVQVCVSAETLQPVPLPPELRARLEA
jgi:YbgC/YbaW family acyl-CoA thioester hydrolase